jgi:hypothetical protein
VVDLGNGEALGRYELQGTFRPVPPQLAAVFHTADLAADAAEQFEATR